MFKFYNVWLPPLEGSKSLLITELLLVIELGAATSKYIQTHFVTGHFNENQQF